MRIEAYTGVQATYNVGKSGKVEKSKKAGSKDALQISEFGREMQVAKQALANTADIREDVVADIKARLQAGEYHVSSEDFANKLLQKYQSEVGLSGKFN